MICLAAGCGVSNPLPEKTLTVSNHKVDLLFKDANGGVTVYRFLDEGGDGATTVTAAVVVAVDTTNNSPARSVGPDGYNAEPWDRCSIMTIPRRELGQGGGGLGIPS